MSLNSQTERAKLNEEVLLKTTSFTRKSLEPIKEESVCSSTDLKSRSKRSSRNDSKLFPQGRASKPCPATQGECPTKKAIAERMLRSQSGSGRSSISFSDASTNKSHSSLLERPFIFRRASSLQKAVQQHEKEVEMYLRNTGVATEIEEMPALASSSPSATTVSTTERDGFSDGKSQTESIPTTASYTSIDKQKLEYLLGVPSDEGEYESTAKKDDIDKVFVDDTLEKSLTGETEAMRQAQRYLRVHRIFEFYQFIVAHLLSALPENPINFLIDLMDRCIIYRAGMGNPPVLYDRKHLDALFNLMDRMRTGYIDKNQYITGMKTLGICSYNPDPPLMENMVSKSFFIEEAHENLVSMLNDIIRRRWIYFNTQPLPMKTPPPTPLYSTRSGKTNVDSKTI